MNSGNFGKVGSLSYINDQPANTFNVALGKIVLLLWEFTDILRMWGVLENLGFEWSLTKFVAKKVSSSGTGLPAVPYCRSTHLTHKTL